MKKCKPKHSKISESQSNYLKPKARITKLYGCANRIAFKQFLKQKRNAKQQEQQEEDDSYNEITTVNKDMLLHQFEKIKQEWTQEHNVIVQSDSSADSTSEMMFAEKYSSHNDLPVVDLNEGLVMEYDSQSEIESSSVVDSRLEEVEISEFLAMTTQQKQQMSQMIQLRIENLQNDIETIRQQILNN